MIDEADHECKAPPGVPQQRRPHAEAWLGKTVAASGDAPRIARSATSQAPEESGGDTGAASGDDASGESH